MKRKTTAERLVDAMDIVRALQPARTTDAEVICTFMEPIDRAAADAGAKWDNYPEYSPDEWWVAGCRPHREPGLWYPSTLTLDRLRLVEVRLTDEQWERYLHNLRESSIRTHGCVKQRFLVHASAADKTSALAAVLRGVVEESIAAPDDSKRGSGSGPLPGPDVTVVRTSEKTLFVHGVTATPKETDGDR